MLHVTHQSGPHAGAVEVLEDSEWDTVERALFAALAEVEADVCPGCGLPLSESLHVDGVEDPVWVTGTQRCTGCEHVELERVKRAKADATTDKDRDRIKPNPEAWFRRTLWRLADALAADTAQRATRPDPTPTVYDGQQVTDR